MMMDWEAASAGRGGRSHEVTPAFGPRRRKAGPAPAPAGGPGEGAEKEPALHECSLIGRRAFMAD